MNISESKDFPVNTKSLKEVRDFARAIFDQSPILSPQKDELILAIAEAAQNIVKHAYKDIKETNDTMKIKISFIDSELEIGFFDKGKLVKPADVKHRKLDGIKPGGLGTCFIKQIMDELVFKEATRWHNHLVLTKNFTGH